MNPAVTAGPGAGTGRAPIATVQPTEYVASIHPEDSVDRAVYEVRVSYRGDDRWAVIHRGRCLGPDGGWRREPRPSARDEDWAERHYRPLPTALRLAAAVAPHVTVDGVTAATALAQDETQTSGAGS